jgi:glycosyltransferase involved in cell wall biosynthesis
LNASASRNVGIDNATGDYVTFLDDDDYYLKDKIARQATKLEQNPQADFCIIDYVSHDANGDSRVCGLQALDDMVPLMRWVPVHTNSLFLRAPVARKVKFNEKLNKFTDLHVTFRLFENYKAVKASGEGSVFERSNRPDQITNTSFARRLKDVGRNYRNWKIICEDFAHIIDKSDILRDVYYRRMAKYALASGHMKEALHYALAWRGKRNNARADGAPRYAVAE